MTYQKDFTLPAELLGQGRQPGLDIPPEPMRGIINAAMQAENGPHPDWQ